LAIELATADWRLRIGILINNHQPNPQSSISIINLNRQSRSSISIVNRQSAIRKSAVANPQSENRQSPFRNPQ